MTVLCGIAGWVDKSLIDSKLFYPLSVKTSGDRLRFYATQFPLVEVDSSYYGIPNPRDKNIYLEQMPDELLGETWERFRAAVEPLRAAGKLGAVFFQFPPWFLPTSRSLAYIEQVQERMFGLPIAVEFRKPEWLDARHGDGTLAFLRSRDIPYVAVDVPEGHRTSMPSVHDVTSSKLAVVRFHGRNHETWDLKGAPPNVRFRYDYSAAELIEWVPRIKEMERSAGRVHALMNNNYSNYSVKNAQQLEKLLEAWQK